MDPVPIVWRFLFDCSWDSVSAGRTGARSEGFCSPEAQLVGGQILGRDL